MASIDCADIDTLILRLNVVSDYDKNKITLGEAIRQLSELGILYTDAKNYLLSKR